MPKVADRAIESRDVVLDNLVTSILGLEPVKMNCWIRRETNVGEIFPGRIHCPCFKIVIKIHLNSDGGADGEDTVVVASSHAMRGGGISCTSTKAAKFRCWWWLYASNHFLRLLGLEPSWSSRLADSPSLLPSSTLPPFAEDILRELYPREKSEDLPCGSFLCKSELLIVLVATERDPQIAQCFSRGSWETWRIVCVRGVDVACCHCWGTCCWCLQRRESSSW